MFAPVLALGYEWNIQNFAFIFCFSNNCGLKYGYNPLINTML